MSSSKDLSSAVSILNRTNYHIWSIQMSNYLHAKGLWQYMFEVSSPASPTGTAAALIAPTATVIAEAAEKQQAWDIKDDEANGLIMLKVDYSLHRQQGITFYRTWESLRTMLNVQGAAALFNNFQMVINYHISRSKHPGAEINALSEMLNRLHTNYMSSSRRCYSSMPCLPLSRRLPPSPFKRSLLQTCSLAACVVISSPNCQRLSARVKTLLIGPRSASSLWTSLIAPQPRAAQTRAKRDPQRSRSVSAAPGSTGSRSVRARGTRTLTWHLLPHADNCYSAVACWTEHHHDHILF